MHAGADLPWSVLLTTLELVVFPFYNTRADLAWRPYTGADIHRSGLALECFLSQYYRGVFSLTIYLLAWSSYTGLELIFAGVD